MKLFKILSIQLFLISGFICAMDPGANDFGSDIAEVGYDSEADVDLEISGAFARVGVDLERSLEEAATRFSRLSSNRSSTTLSNMFWSRSSSRPAVTPTPRTSLVLFSGSVAEGQRGSTPVRREKRGTKRVREEDREELSLSLKKLKKEEDFK
jgi:hypothetical protein